MKDVTFKTKNYFFSLAGYLLNYPLVSGRLIPCELYYKAGFQRFGCGVLSTFDTYGQEMFFLGI
jgi:hypothetical protein